MFVVGSFDVVLEISRPPRIEHGRNTTSHATHLRLDHPFQKNVKRIFGEALFVGGLAHVPHLFNG